MNIDKVSQKTRNRKKLWNNLTMIYNDTKTMFLKADLCYLD